MKRATLTIAVALLCSTAAAAPLVTFESPCECRDNRATARWSAKTEPSLPPTDPNVIKSVTPSDIFSWQGPTEPLTRDSERIAAEQKWFALTGRVIELRAEADGDLHVALQDATGVKPGMVIVELPCMPQWCDLRKIVLGWTQTQFPLRILSSTKLDITRPPVITVTGKAFFDISHAPPDQSNRRTDLQGYSAWEIHPVMKLEIQ
jgi:hypothetical protein